MTPFGSDSRALEQVFRPARAFVAQEVSAPPAADSSKPSPRHARDLAIGDQFRDAGKPNQQRIFTVAGPAGDDGFIPCSSDSGKVTYFHRANLVEYVCKTNRFSYVANG